MARSNFTIRGALRHILLCFVFSLIFAETISVVCAACAIRVYSLRELWVMAVLQVASVYGFVVSLVATPLVMVVLRPRSYPFHLMAGLWFVLVAYCFIFVSRGLPWAVGGLFILAFAGLLAIGVIDRLSRR